MAWEWVEWALHVDFIMAEWAAIAPDGVVLLEATGAATEAPEVTVDTVVGDMVAGALGAGALGAEDATVVDDAEKYAPHICVSHSIQMFPANLRTRQLSHLSRQFHWNI
jgi:hypothetical protein